MIMFALVFWGFINMTHIDVSEADVQTVYQTLCNRFIYIPDTLCLW